MNALFKVIRKPISSHISRAFSEKAESDIPLRVMKLELQVADLKSAVLISSVSSGIFSGAFLYVMLK